MLRLAPHARFVLRVAERSPRWAAPASIALCFAGVASYVWDQ